MADLYEPYDVRAVFRRYPEGEIIALFPDEPADDRGHVVCYAHMGQHGAASTTRVVGDTRPATPAEYAPLKRELESIGYRIEVSQRCARRRKAVLRG